MHVFHLRTQPQVQQSKGYFCRTTYYNYITPSGNLLFFLLDLQQSQTETKGNEYSPQKLEFIKRVVATATELILSSSLLVGGVLNSTTAIMHACEVVSLRTDQNPCSCSGHAFRLSGYLRGSPFRFGHVCGKKALFSLFSSPYACSPVLSEVSTSSAMCHVIYPQYLSHLIDS